MAATAEGTTLNVGGLINGVVDFSYSESAAAIDVTGLEDSVHSFEPGPDTRELTVTVVGIVSKTVGAVDDTVVITLGGGTSVTISNAVLVSMEYSGSVDDRMTTSLTWNQGIAS